MVIGAVYWPRYYKLCRLAAGSRPSERETQCWRAICLRRLTFLCCRTINISLLSTDFAMHSWFDFMYDSGTFYYHYYYAHAPNSRGALSDDAVWRLSVCLSRTSSLSREQRGLGRPKLAHVTRTPLSRSKGQRSRSLFRFIQHGVYASGSCSGHRGNVFTVGTYCYVAVKRGRLGGARRFGVHRERRGSGAYSGGSRTA